MDIKNDKKTTVATSGAPQGLSTQEQTFIIGDIPNLEGGVGALTERKIQAQDVERIYKDFIDKLMLGEIDTSLSQEELKAVLGHTSIEESFEPSYSCLHQAIKKGGTVLDTVLQLYKDHPKELELILDFVPSGKGSCLGNAIEEDEKILHAILQLYAEYPQKLQLTLKTTEDLGYSCFSCIVDKDQKEYAFSTILNLYLQQPVDVLEEVMKGVIKLLNYNLGYEIDLTKIIDYIMNPENGCPKPHLASFLKCFLRNFPNEASVQILQGYVENLKFTRTKNAGQKYL